MFWIGLIAGIAVGAALAPMWIAIFNAIRDFIKSKTS